MFQRRIGIWKRANTAQPLAFSHLAQFLHKKFEIYFFFIQEYHTNNLLKPVLFEEAATNLPEDAITIEIAPHGLLQAIIKRCVPKGLHIPLTNRGNKENTNFFLSALGK